MLPRITETLIHQAIQTEAMIRAGESYCWQGKVKNLALDAEMAMITADVLGSAADPYKVTIICNDGDPDTPLDVDCSCPIGFGCKHGAAVLYAAQAQMEVGVQISIPAAIAKPVSPPQLKTAPLPHPLFFWLAEAQSYGPMRQASANDVVYVLAPHTLHTVKKVKGQQAPIVAAALPYNIFAKVLLKEPGASGGRTWFEPNPYNLYWLDQVPTPLDAWLIKRVHDRHGDLCGGSLKGLAGANWLERALTTGNVRWRMPDGPVVHAAEPIKASFSWVTVGANEQRLTLADVPAGMTLIALAPPALIDSATGAVHWVASGLEDTLAERLLHLPPVPPYAVHEVAEKWGRVAGGAVAPPVLHNLVDRGILTPTPLLTFREEGVDILLPYRAGYRNAGTMRVATATARLSFDYEGFPVTHATEATLIVDVSDEGAVQFQRDLVAEKSAFTRMAGLGLRPIKAFPDVRAKANQSWDLAIQIGAVPVDYADILQRQVLRLREEGWRIAYAPRWSLAFVELEPGSLGFDVNPSGIDWFDITLGARIDGKTIDILPLLRRMLGRHGAALLDHPGEMLPVEIASGKLAQIPMELVRPVLEILLMFALQERYGNERLRLPARDLAALADFESGTKAHIPWTGAEPLRSLARSLAHLHLAPTKTPTGFTATLRPYQQQGLDWLQALHGAGFGGVLADDMGLGKTVQALAHIATLKASKALEGPVLIVCPTSVLPNWQAELAQFAPELTTLLWHGANRKTLAAKIGKQDVIVTSYPLLMRDIETLKAQSLSLIIYDEAQMLKNSKTAGFKAARQMKAVQTLALTGTPVENQLSDAWSLMELVTPGLLGTLDHFNRTIAKPITRDNDPAAKAMLARRLRPFMLRRTKDQVASDLPAKIEIPEWIDLGGRQLELYESMRLLMQKKVRDEIERVGLMRSHIIFLDALLKLRQICCDPRLLQPDTLATSAKLVRMMEMLPELLAEGRKVIVFSQFTSMLDLIKPELGGRGIDFTEIRGKTKDRSAPVTAFQAGAVSVILVSLKAGGTGLNLTAADTVILFDPWWNPAVEAQAIDRAHRIGQAKPVFVHRFIARGTVEEKILSLQAKKRSLAATLWGDADDGVAPAKLSEADVRFLLG